MKEEVRLYRILFIVSICLLLLNDLYLKYSYHNWLTGKLSDFAGLFAFPFFWSCVFPRKIKIIYISTAVLFIFWKSEISQPVIEFFQSFGLPINRTVDNTDLIALIILPLSYFYWNLDLATNSKIKKTFTVCIKGVSIIAFIATTLPKESYDYNFKSRHVKVVKSDMETVRSRLTIYQMDDGNMYNYDFSVPENNAQIHTKVAITEVKDNQILIKLDSVLLFTSVARSIKLSHDQKERMRSLRLSDIERIFDQEIDRQLIIKQ